MDLPGELENLPDLRHEAREEGWAFNRVKVDNILLPREAIAINLPLPTHPQIRKRFFHAPILERSDLSVNKNRTQLEIKSAENKAMGSAVKCPALACEYSSKPPSRWFHPGFGVWGEGWVSSKGDPRPEPAALPHLILCLVGALDHCRTARYPAVASSPRRTPTGLASST